MIEPEVVNRREANANKFFTFAEEDLRLPDGKGYTYYQLESNYDAVVVVPVTTDGQLILERIYRHPYRKWFWEFPAGGIEPGEDPLAAAARELTEETGYVAAAVEPLYDFCAMPGLLNMSVYLVLARDCRLEAKPELEDMELLEAQLVSEERAWELSAEKPASSFLTCGLLAWSHWRRVHGE